MLNTLKISLILLPALFLFTGCDDDSVKPVEQLFEELSSEDIATLSQEGVSFGLDPIFNKPKVFQKEEYNKFIDHCALKVKTLRAFINDVSSAQPLYKKIPHIDEIFAHIALQHGYWDGKTELNVKTIFTQLLPYAMKDQSFTYGCDVMRGRQAGQPARYHVMEDSITGALGGLQDVPELYFLLEKRHPQFHRFNHFTLLKDTVSSFITRITALPVGDEKPELLMLTYNQSPKTQFLKIAEDAGFSRVGLTFNATNRPLVAAHKLINLTYFDSYDPHANSASFYHNLLTRISFSQNYFVTAEKFTKDLMDPQNYQKERLQMSVNNFLDGHAEAIKAHKAHVVSPLSATSMFDNKLYGIIAEKLTELYFGEQSSIKNPKTQFFFSYDTAKLDENLLDEVFDAAHYDTWVIKKTVGLASNAIYILKTLTDEQRLQLKDLIKLYPHYFIAQPLIDIDTHHNLVYEIRTIGLSSPDYTSFYPVPYVRGKTQFGADEYMIPAFVLAP